MDPEGAAGRMQDRVFGWRKRPSPDPGPDPNHSHAAGGDLLGLGPGGRRAEEPNHTLMVLFSAGKVLVIRPSGDYGTMVWGLGNALLGLRAGDSGMPYLRREPSESSLMTTSTERNDKPVVGLLARLFILECR